MTSARGDGGAALVEFALVLPFLAILVFGAIDLGRVYELKNSLTNMAREGGVYGQYFPTRVSGGGNCADGKSITARALAEDSDVTDVTITVRNRTTGVELTGCETGTAAPGSRLEVKATKSLTPFTPLLSTVLGSETIQVSGQIEMAVQG